MARYGHFVIFFVKRNFSLARRNIMRNQIITIFLSVLLTIATLTFVRSQNLLANNQMAANNTPAYISHQGFLAESDGEPLGDGNYDMQFGVYTAASGGSLIWEETQDAVPVSQGFFTVLLGNGTCTTGCPLGPDTFDNTPRYLQTSLDTGTGFVDFPRQLLGSVPYAFQAASVPWSGVTNPPDISDTLADLSCANGQIAKWNGSDWVCAEDLVGSGGDSYENVIVVAKSGGDFTSVAAALDSISDASSTNRYLVRVAPGIYSESNAVQVPGYVHLQGDGPNVTVITSNRGAAVPNNTAATIDMLENSRLSNLAVRNTGTGPLSFGIYMVETSRDTVIDNVDVVVDGAGAGGARSGIHLNSAAPTIKNSSFKASGATGFGTSVNAGLSSVHTAGGGFPQALILNSIFLGGATSTVQNCNDNSGTGFGMQLNEATPDIRHSHICGGHRGIALLQNGNPRVENSEIRVSSTGSAFLFEISVSGSISVATSGIAYVGNKFTGAGTGLRCVHNFAWGTWAPLSNGTTVGTACN
jgi:hypothetical protein